MIKQEYMDDIFLYSHYYGNMLYLSKHLYDNEEGYAAVVILFNSIELIFKSVRENYGENFHDDIDIMKERNLLNESEYKFLTVNKNSVRKIRNLMMHKDASQYFFEDNSGVLWPFTESETWMKIYENFAPQVIAILGRLVKKVEDIT